MYVVLALLFDMCSSNAIDMRSRSEVSAVCFWIFAFGLLVCDVMV